MQPGPLGLRLLDSGVQVPGLAACRPHSRTSSRFTLLTPKGTTSQEPRAASLYFSQDCSWRCQGEHEGWLRQARGLGQLLRVSIGC